MAAEGHIPADIRDAASRWLTARDAGLLDDESEQALGHWLSADPLHSAAFLELEGLWNALDEPDVQNALRARHAGENVIVLTPERNRRARPWIGGAIAASLAIIAIGTAYDWPTRMRADAMTATGEQRSVTLADGSVALLNTDSAIAIDYRPHARIVRLLKGEALFKVAPDRARPFTVESGSGSTTALGTQFIIRREDASTDVTVTEHRVRVAWATPQAGQVDLKQGFATRYGPNGSERPHPIDIGTASAWTHGVLLFVNRPLGEVVAELNRYHAGYIRVIGTGLAQRRVSGGFRSDNPLGALDTIEKSLGISSTRLTDRLIFVHN